MESSVKNTAQVKMLNVPRLYCAKYCKEAFMSNICLLFQTLCTCWPLNMDGNLEKFNRLWQALCHL